MMKRKVFAVLLVLLVANSVVFSNGQKENMASGTSVKKQEITFWNLGTESPDRDIYKYSVDKYNKNATEYMINNIPTQNDTYKEKLIIAMSSGECPDMYVSWSGGPMNEYIRSGYAQSIDDLFKASGLSSILMDASVAQASYEGKVYSLPFLSISIAGIFYNKDMFAQYGLAVPKTLSELEHVCEVLRANGIIPFALANKSKWTGSMYFMSLAARKGGLGPFNAAVAGTGSFEDESFVYAGQKIQEWVKKGYFPEGVNSLSEDDGQSRQLLYQGKAAMELIGSWYTGTIPADSKEFYKKIGWFAFPAIEGSNADPSIQIGTIGDQFVSFNCTGDKLKAAFGFASTLLDEDAIKVMVANGKIPPVKDIDKYVQDPVVIQILDAAKKASSVQLWYDQYLPPAVAQVHLSTCQELFGLTMTPQEAAKELQAAMVKNNSGN
jgi:raffinose/stachyose/melibiose transport system substrate-binding protein